MANNGYSSLQACRLRVARLDDGGAPEEGETNLYVSDALIDIGVSVEVSEGAEIEQKNGCGEICVAFKDVDHIKRVGLSANLCRLDFELLEMLTGGSIATSGGDTIGYLLPATDDSPQPVSVEVWTKAWDRDQPAVDGPDTVYFQWVYPSTTWVPGTRTLENGALIFPVTGKGIANAGFGLGPGGDLPVEIPGAEGIFEVTGLPDAVLGYQELVLAGS